MSHAIRSGLSAAGIVAAAALAIAAPARQPHGRPADKIPASGGDIAITPIFHATMQIRHGGHVIDVDPMAQGNYSSLEAPDIILITDVHSDHLDPAAVAKLKKASTKVVAPSAAAARLEGAIVIANGETKTVDGVSIQAVPMYNLTRGPAPGRLFHDKGRGNGYVVTLGGKRIYIAGDTECIPEMKALKNVDVAFVPMNPYTMTAAEAAECVKAFKPKIVYPYHYAGSDPEELYVGLKDSGVEVRIRDWYMK